MLGTLVALSEKAHSAVLLIVAFFRCVPGQLPEVLKCKGNSIDYVPRRGRSIREYSGEVLLCPREALSHRLAEAYVPSSSRF